MKAPIPDGQPILASQGHRARKESRSADGAGIHPKIQPFRRKQRAKRLGNPCQQGTCVFPSRRIHHLRPFLRLMASTIPEHLLKTLKK